MLSCFHPDMLRDCIIWREEVILSWLSVCAALLFSLAKHLWSVKLREKQNTSLCLSPRVSQWPGMWVNQWMRSLSVRPRGVTSNKIIICVWKSSGKKKLSRPGSRHQANIGCCSDNISASYNHLLCSLSGLREEIWSFKKNVFQNNLKPSVLSNFMPEWAILPSLTKKLQTAFELVVL